MNANTQFEIEAYAFKLMTGHMAPGKDSPAAAGPTDEEERERQWLAWKATNRVCVQAMIYAFDHVTGDKP